jgi:catechol 2,3-dioxygenase-like lactoylglutathione lyase family enzyme
METTFESAIPVIPAADVSESLHWWTAICGFDEVFRDDTPPNYAGIKRGAAQLHISAMSDKSLARQVGDQTMLRFVVSNVAAFYSEYQQRGGQVHPNGELQTKPWGTTEFAAIDPTGVCVTFQESR